jgi:hypothetical protein
VSRPACVCGRRRRVERSPNRKWRGGKESVSIADPRGRAGAGEASPHAHLWGLPPSFRGGVRSISPRGEPALRSAEDNQCAPHPELRGLPVLGIAGSTPRIGQVGRLGRHARIPPSRWHWRLHAVRRFHCSCRLTRRAMAAPERSRTAACLLGTAKRNRRGCSPHRPTYGCRTSASRS